MGLVKDQVPTVYGSNYVPELTYTTPTHQLLIDHGCPLTTMDAGPPTYDKTSSQPQAQTPRKCPSFLGPQEYIVSLKQTSYILSQQRQYG
ncbi:hypothetical protein J4Q44_G00334350 [Coregonus suidteri]|uniref:Uncharacterized protein n=1 Tax=Coregonus suidteri TaxID=861788 RepID=A0AAN8KQQ5_9TELE